MCVSVSVCLSVCLSLSVYLSVSVCMSLSVCLSVSLSPSHSSIRQLQLTMHQIALSKILGVFGRAVPEHSDVVFQVPVLTLVHHLEQQDERPVHVPPAARLRQRTWLAQHQWACKNRKKENKKRLTPAKCYENCYVVLD